MPWIIPAVMAVASGVQAVSAASKRKKAEKALEKQADSYKPNESIMDYYNKALSKYDPNPYNSLGYKQQTNQNLRNLTTGINAAQNRRIGVGAVSGLVQATNDANSRAAAQAEQQQAQALGQLGQAAGMKTQEERYPFEMRYNLLAAKAGQAAQRQNMATQNAFSNANNAATLMAGGTNTDKAIQTPAWMERDNSEMSWRTSNWTRPKLNG
jgi:hypothetical protein